MESDEPRFTHIGLSSDRAVIFCAMDNGKTYPMPVHALDQAEDWDPEAKPKAAGIIHDGYAAFVDFDTGVKIDFASDFVLHVCEPAYPAYKGKGRPAWAVGGRVRQIRQWRGLTLDALAAKCGIAKPNLSRLENGKVTPTFETLRTVAAALDTHPALLVQKDAWTWTRHEFGQWLLGLRHTRGPGMESVPVTEMVTVFLKKRPEHRYARRRLLEGFERGRGDAELALDARKWACEKAEVDATPVRANRATRKSNQLPVIGAGMR